MTVRKGLAAMRCRNCTNAPIILVNLLPRIEMCKTHAAQYFEMLEFPEPPAEGTLVEILNDRTGQTWRGLFIRAEEWVARHEPPVWWIRSLKHKGTTGTVPLTAVTFVHA